MNTSLRRWAAPAMTLGAIGLFWACGEGQSGQPARSPEPTVATIAEAKPSPSGASSSDAVSSSDPSASASPTPDGGKPRLCGCGLCEPLPSEDPCTKDADCAPSDPCHAPRCVAAAKAKPRPRGTMCTEILACNTADANACVCHEGRCALVPRTK